eukprot:g9318.t1
MATSGAYYGAGGAAGGGGAGGAGAEENGSKTFKRPAAEQLREVWFSEAGRGRVSSMAESSRDDDVGELKEQDGFLPIANINRIVKRRLPYNAKVAKEAKETTQECVSEFICWITADASDKCQDEKRRTINGEDIITSMNTLGFYDYIEPLKVYLAKYRASVKGDKNAETNAASSNDPISASYQGGGGGSGGGGGGGSASGDLEDMDEEL